MLDAPAAETVIQPLTLVAPFLGGSFVRSTRTFAAVGVVPPAGLTTIQGALVTARHVSAAPVLMKRTCSERRTHARVEDGWSRTRSRYR